MRLPVAEPPTLSVVIPTRDRPISLREALESVVRVASDEEHADEPSALRLEIIVVDDHSQADLSQICAGFGARLLAVRGNGISAARNTGLAVARGRHVLFLDDDDVILPGHVRPHLRLLERCPDLDGVFGQYVVAAPDLTTIRGPYPVSASDPLRTMLSSFVQIGAFVVRRAACEENGPFDESLVVAEDWDWTLRLARWGRLEFVPVPSVAYRQRPEGTADQLELERLPMLRQVYWRHVRAAGAGRVGLRWASRTYLRHSGTVAGHLLRSCILHSRRGDRAAGRAVLWGALRTSPLHVVAALLRDRDLAPAVVTTLRPGAHA